MLIGNVRESYLVRRVIRGNHDGRDMLGPVDNPVVCQSELSATAVHTSEARD